MEYVGAVAAHVIGKGEARLVVVRVAFAAIGDQRMTEAVGVVAVGVEVVAQSQVEDKVGDGMPGVLDECTVEIRARTHIGRAHAVEVPQRKGAIVGHVDEKPVLERIDAQTLVDVLNRDAALQLVSALSEDEMVMDGVAKFPRSSGAQKISQDVGACHEGVAIGEPLGHAGRVGRFEIAA